MQNRPRDRLVLQATNSVEVYPPDMVKRRTLAWDGMAAEIVEATRPGKIEFRFSAPLHLLAVYGQGMRTRGEAFVAGLPPSKSRDVRGKLTLVPAGHAYHERQQPPPLAPVRIVYFYFDPARMPPCRETNVPAALAPRLFFDNATLSETALKLARLIENTVSDSSPYLEALGLVLSHELVRWNAAPPSERSVRGGLATWQQRMVAAYIEEHLAEPISLTALARLIGQSRYHFCRAFRQSFGTPPHRYHGLRRMDRAKTLLTQSALSVTEIGSAVGFCETSSFTAAFRRATDQTPTAYRRSLESTHQSLHER
jgi:AraC family transcriptional regulator